MQLKLKQKLIGGFLIVALFVVFAGGFGMFMSGKIGRSSDVVAKNMTPVQYSAFKASTALAQLKENLLYFSQSTSGL